MNLAHVHLVLNHVPTVGFGLCFVLFIFALFQKSEDLKRSSLMLFVVIALLTIPVYLSGSAAEFVVRNQPGISPNVIAAHQDAAMLALMTMELTGVIAWLALWRFRSAYMPVVLVLSIVTLGLTARAATIGGEIRHPEILAPGAAASVPSWPRAAAAAQALIVVHPWVWPICEILHFVGLTMLVGVVLLLNLRILGFIKGVAFSDLRRLLPWAMAGLFLNVVTGMLFFLALPDQYTQNRSFTWKIGLMLAAAMTLLYQTVFDTEGRTKPESEAPPMAKAVAASSIVLWVAVIFFGRFLPYIGSE